MNISSLVAQLKGVFGFVTATRDPLNGVVKNLVGFSVPNPVVSVGCLGDSITAMCWDYSVAFNGVVGDTSLSNYGWLFWWKFFTRAPLKFTRYAVAGKTSADVVAEQLATAIAANHDIYTLEIGINDAAISGSQTLENVTTVYRAVRSAGKKLLIWTATPIESFSTSKNRFSVFNAGIRALALSDPACVKVMDAKSAMSNPGSTDGAAYDAATGFDLTYDQTHPNATGAMILGRLAALTAAPWTGVHHIGPHSNGDAKNLLANTALGGTSGTLPAGGSGVVANSWTATRSASTVTTTCYKVKSIPRVLEVGATPALGTRCKILGITDYHYIVIATGTAVTTLPSSTVLFSETQPDGAGGTQFLTLPANDKPGMVSPFRGIPFESQYIDVVDSTTTNTSVNLNQAVTTGFAVGDNVRASCEIEMLESPWQAFALRISAITAGSVKTNDSFGPSYNVSNASLIEPNLAGLCETLDDYQVPANTASLIFRLYIFNRSANIHTRLLVHHPAMENLSS